VAAAFVFGAGAAWLCRPLVDQATSPGQPSPLLSNFSFRAAAERHAGGAWEVLRDDPSRDGKFAMREFVAVGPLPADGLISLLDQLGKEAEGASGDAGWELLERGQTLDPGAVERAYGTRSLVNYHLGWRKGGSSVALRLWLARDGEGRATLTVLVCEWR
jgi:hypothetical protein